MNQADRDRRRRVTYEEDRSEILPLDTYGQGIRRRRRKPKLGEGSPTPTRIDGPQDEDAGVADAYSRINAMMRHGLETLSEVSTAIDDDGKSLRHAKDNQMITGGTVKASRSALWTLRSQEMRETVVLWCAIAFFYSVALFVMWTRVRIPFLLW